MPATLATAPDPSVALLAFAMLVAAGALLVWPERGLVARWARRGRMPDRVRTEDALKHLYTVAAARLPATVDSLAGALGISRARAVAIVRRLEETDLVRLATGNIELTEVGRAYALRIVRTHRLWERYLADRTGAAPAEWHAQAERLEHGLTEEQVEGLAARMGHPLYDPHGDPIPTAAGVLPPPRGQPLASVPVGTALRVTHVEDEPDEVYQVLRQAGIHPGTLLRVEAAGATRLGLLVEGRPLELDRLAAMNLSVEPVEEELIDPELERLDVLRPGEEAVVVRLAGAVQGAQRRRLLDLGIVPGTVIRAELASASGDPIAYRIRGAVIALRRGQADDVLIRRVPVGAAA